MTTTDEILRQEEQLANAKRTLDLDAIDAHRRQRRPHAEVNAHVALARLGGEQARDLAHDAVQIDLVAARLLAPYQRA